MSERKARQAQTRRALLDAARRVFGCKGFKASIDEVASEAGYTKGAVYANFSSKEELFLTLLDERFAARVEEIKAVFGDPDSPVEDTVRRGAETFMAYIDSDREWDRLFFEAAVHAARDAAFREQLVARYRGLRAEMAEVYTRFAAVRGEELPLPAAHIASMVFAMANGIALDRLLEPEAVPDDLFSTLMTTFVAGLMTQVESPQP